MRTRWKRHRHSKRYRLPAFHIHLVKVTMREKYGCGVAPAPPRVKYSTRLLNDLKQTGLGDVPMAANGLFRQVKNL